jgi:hypothetical protein
VRTLSDGFVLFVGFGDIEKIRHDLAHHLDGHGIAAAVERFADRQPDPAFADAIFFEVGFFLALEAHADATSQHGGIVKRAARVHVKSVGRRVGHLFHSQKGAQRVCWPGSLSSRRHESPGTGH